MSFLLVPREVTATTVEVWLAAAQEPAFGTGVPSMLGHDGAQWGLSAAGWARWATDGGGRTLVYRMVTLRDLDPGRWFELEWEVDGEVVARGSVSTLPRELPAEGEEPLTVFLGSCFSQAKDRTGRVGQQFAAAARQRQVRLKFLMGDQVYLDDPWAHFLKHTHTAEELQIRFFDSYLRTWTQSVQGGGFAELLATGANYFCADDHELYNNAPNGASLVRDTWTERGRKRWLEPARALFDIFQTPRRTTRFDISPLSFFVADTRLDREPGDHLFMTATALGRLRGWVQGLRGPGMLVLGQPVFEHARSAFSRRFIDRVLPDYAQYGELMDALVRSEHSIVVLSGDVHFGRITRCDVAGGGELLEVISSPMALVDKNVGGKWRAPPAVLPDRGAAGTDRIPRAPTVCEEAWRLARDHFVTLELTSLGPKAAVMSVDDWPILPDVGGGVRVMDQKTLR